MLFILKLLSSSLSGAPFPLKIYCLIDKTPPAYVANIKTSKAAARYTKHFKLKSIHLKQTWTIHTKALQRKRFTATCKKLANFYLWRDYVQKNTAHLRTEHKNFKGYGTSLSGKPTFFKGTCPLEWKCSLNAAIFKRELRLFPLIKIGKNWPRTMFKGRAFEKCIAT